MRALYHVVLNLYKTMLDNAIRLVQSCLTENCPSLVCAFWVIDKGCYFLSRTKQLHNASMVSTGKLGVCFV